MRFYRLTERIWFRSVLPCCILAPDCRSGRITADKKEIKDFPKSRQVGTSFIRETITEKGLDALQKKEKDINRYHIRRFSKEACAVYSLWGNVGLSVLEFIIGFLSGSIGLIADAIHTAVDIIASAITWIGIKTNKEAQAALIGETILCGIGAR